MSTFVSLASDQSEALLGSILFQAGQMSTAIRAIAGARFDLAQCETGLEFLCEESSFSRLGKNLAEFLGSFGPVRLATRGGTDARSCDGYK